MKRKGQKSKTEHQRDKNARSEHRKKTRLNTKRILIAIAVVIIGIALGITINNIITLQLEKAELLDRQIQLKQEKAEFEEKIQQVNSDEYIENEARRILRMVKPKEILFELGDDNE
ncbi:MAG: septum formation initiator family protein [Enterococcus sp.]|nr:septum formation initiator family protein [Enterococcus sp.]